MHLELLYCPYGTDGNIVNPFDHDFSLTSLEKAMKIEKVTEAELRKISTQKKKEMFIRGVLSVTVISAEDLPVVDFMGKADPFVVLIMKKSEAKQKTRVRFKFSNCSLFLNYFSSNSYTLLIQSSSSGFSGHK